jgi:flagellar hook-basal body complex protein FliE
MPVAPAIGSITSLAPTRVGEVDVRSRTRMDAALGDALDATRIGDLRPPVESPLSPIGAPASEPTPQVSFEQVLGRMVDGAASADRAADAQVEALAVGASDDIHGTMISVKEAEISLKLVASVRNKLLDAFHELWRTSV